MNHKKDAMTAEIELIKKELAHLKHNAITDKERHFVNRINDNLLNLINIIKTHAEINPGSPEIKKNMDECSRYFQRLERCFEKKPLVLEKLKPLSVRCLGLMLNILTFGVISRGVNANWFNEKFIENKPIDIEVSKRIVNARDKTTQSFHTNYSKFTEFKKRNLEQNAESQKTTVSENTHPSITPKGH